MVLVMWNVMTRPEEEVMEDKPVSDFNIKQDKIGYKYFTSRIDVNELHLENAAHPVGIAAFKRGLSYM